MRFFADLHVHSRFSRATSRDLTIRALARGAAQKGIRVMGTGDFTHPEWFGELEQNLEEAAPGLYRLRQGAENVSFMLTAEISTIYKQGDRVRKVHHVLGAPDLETVRRISSRLAVIGNIVSDGRPILGISSRDLLEIVLEASADAFLIPAHIWTPWFSALGSKSGFDSIRDCYLDLEPHIFALETGLSSDPAMNWRVSTLDRYHLVSSSDAHSAAKLGREATVFDCEPDYFQMLRALRTGEGLSGTVEFFPEEGKYHLDGHRECAVVLEPEETVRLGGICPVCGRSLTVGVLNRVLQLADRGPEAKPATARPYESLIPLAEVLGEIMQTGSASKRVMQTWQTLVGRLGGELPLLLDADLAEIRSVGGEVLALGIERMRAGEVHRTSGFDGQFGVIRVFKDNEKDLLFKDALPGRKSPRTVSGAANKAEPGAAVSRPLRFNAAQQRVIACVRGNLMVQAGPGTGKTRVLVERICSIRKTDPASRIMAITFTTRAADEIRARLGAVTADVYTFHALAAAILHAAGCSFKVLDEKALAALAGAEASEDFVADLIKAQSLCRELDERQQALVARLAAGGSLTFEGMIIRAMEQLASGTLAYDHIMVDEFQDINPLQFDFLKKLARGSVSLMVIGDRNQAIYGFRGSSSAAFEDFNRVFAPLAVTLEDTYRLNMTVAGAAAAFMNEPALTTSRKGDPINVITTAWPADYIAEEIEALAGGLISSRVRKAKGEYALSDLAVIVRTRSQVGAVTNALARAAIPFEAAYGRAWAERAGVRERLALLKKDDWQSLVRGLGKEERAAAEDFLSGLAGPLKSRIMDIERSGLFRLPPLEPDNLFYHYAGIFRDDLAGFGEFLLLSHDQGALSGEKVRVLTAHAAKGLEFKCVFICGVADGIFPLNGNPLSEELNLFYVAMTRAIDRLYLVRKATEAAAFIGRIPPEFLVSQDVIPKRRSKQLLLF